MNKLSTLLFTSLSVFMFSVSGCNKGGSDSKQETITLSFENSSYELFEDETIVVTCNNSSTRTITYSSSDTSVASINSAGRIIGKKAGTTTIKASIDDVVATAELTVKPLSEKNEDYIVCNNKEMPIGLNEDVTYFINAQYYHDGEVDETKKISFESLDKELATVDRDGEVHVLKAGYVGIKVYSGDISTITYVDIYNIKINNTDDWDLMLQTVDYYQARFYLDADLDFTGITYKTYAGYNSDWTVCTYLMGTLEGNYHEIKNITMSSSVEKQSIFGYSTAFVLQNIKFTNINFNSPSSGMNCGLFNCLMHHRTIIASNGDRTNQVEETLVNNVLCDFVVNNTISNGIAGTFYGGGISSTFFQFRHKDGSKLSANKIYPIAQEYITWWDPNFVSNFVAYIPNGDATLTPASNSMSSVTVTCTNVYKTSSLIEADYLVSQYFDNNIWDVEPNTLPDFKY